MCSSIKIASLGVAPGPKIVSGHSVGNHRPIRGEASAESAEAADDKNSAMVKTMTNDVERSALFAVARSFKFIT
ncbi:MAG TPA: hypothetical protein DEA50_08640 [Parvularcula sp.]|nr:hypothetical protein [Parvularcula sp.]